MTAYTVGRVETGHTFRNHRTTLTAASGGAGQVESLDAGSAGSGQVGCASQAVVATQDAVLGRNVVAGFTCGTVSGRLATGTAGLVAQVAAAVASETSGIIASQTLLADGGAVTDLAVVDQGTALGTGTCVQVILQFADQAGGSSALPAVGHLHTALLASTSTSVEVVAHVAGLATGRRVAGQAASRAVGAHASRTQVI